MVAAGVDPAAALTPWRENHAEKLDRLDRLREGIDARAGS